MAKPQEKARAYSMRRQGASIKEIADTLGVSKGSVSSWCRDIVLTGKQRRALFKKQMEAGNVGRLIGADMNRRKKTETIDRYLREGRSLLSSLSERERLLAGIGVYWGEGSKTSHLSVINSDKTMIAFMINWFRELFGVPDQAFVPRIYINHQHRTRKDTIEAYWSEQLNLPRSQFKKTIFINRRNKKKYENKETYYGLLSLRIKRGTDLKYRILGLIEGLKYSTF